MPVTTLLILATTLLLSGFFRSIQDALYDEANIFRQKFGPRWFGTPSETSGNKYRNGDETQGKAFPGSTTWLVFLTDGWHFFQMLSLTSWQIGLATAIAFNGVFAHPWEVFGIGLVTAKVFHNVPFELGFRVWKKVDRR